MDKHRYLHIQFTAKHWNANSRVYGIEWSNRQQEQSHIASIPPILLISERPGQNILPRPPEHSRAR